MLNLEPGDTYRVKKESEVLGKGGGRKEKKKSPSPHLELYSLLHGAQVHRNVGSIGDQAPIRPKEGTGEVKAFFDVGGDGCALKDSAHLFWGAQSSNQVAPSFTKKGTGPTG